MRPPLLLGLYLIGCGGVPLPERTSPAPAHVRHASSRGSPPASSPATPRSLVADDGSGVRVVLDHAVAAVAIARDRIVFLEPDFVHLTAVQPETGAEVWSIQIQSDASGQHSVYPLAGAIVVHAGDRLFFVDPFSGQILRRNLGVPHCPFVEEQGACAFQCDCALFVASCDEGKEVTHLLGSEIHIYHDLGEPHDTVCALQPYLVGRSGNRIVAMAEGAKLGSMGADGVLVTLDATSGRELHRGPDVPKWSNEAGIVPATGGCWVATRDSGALAMHDCASGALRWRARVGGDEDHTSMRVRVTPEGLFVRRTQHNTTDLALLDPASGTLLWRRQLGAGVTGLTADDDPEEVHVHDGSVYELLDRADGHTTARFELEAAVSLSRDGAGYVVRGGGFFRELDAQGRETRAFEYADGNTLVHVAPTHLIESARDPERELRFRRRSDLEVVRRLPGSFLWERSGELGERFVVLHVPAADEADMNRVVIVDLGS
jgi:outer membrane protein assembly factor BamB